MAGYTWDYENRLTSVTLPGSGGTVTFKYDPFGRRIQKSGPAGITNLWFAKTRSRLCRGRIRQRPF
ncbi:MAG: RHS repeat protein [Acidobacteriia bacterium]|nr:RHS repeat protein [Terriglobia bacterium]